MDTTNIRVRQCYQFYTWFLQINGLFCGINLHEKEKRILVNLMNDTMQSMRDMQSTLKELTYISSRIYFNYGLLSSL